MSSIHKTPEGKHRVKFRHVGGKQDSINFNTLKGAQDWKLQLDALGPVAALKLLDDESESELTLVAHCEIYIEHLTGVTNGTKRTYRHYIVNHFESIGKTPLTAVTANVISTWINELVAKGLSGKTIKNLHSFLSAALTVAVRDDLITKNPAKGLKLPRPSKKEMEFLSPAEFGDLFDLLDLHYRPLAMTLVATGIRFSEATAITVSSIDFKKNRIHISKAWKYTGTTVRELGAPKTETSDRIVVMPQPLRDVLEPLCKGMKREDFIFKSRQGAIVSHQIFFKNWRKAVMQFGEETGKYPRIHDLRHTFASWAIASGHSPKVIQANLGHNSIKTTFDRYGHLDQREYEALAASTGRSLPQTLAIEG